VPNNKLGYITNKTNSMNLKNILLLNGAQKNKNKVPNNKLDYITNKKNSQY